MALDNLGTSNNDKFTNISKYIILYVKHKQIIPCDHVILFIYADTNHIYNPFHAFAITNNVCETKVTQKDEAR